MRYRFFILMLLILSIKSFAQDSTCIEEQKYNFSQFGKETGTFIKDPIHWKGSNWLKFGIVSASAFLLIEYADDPIHTAIIRNHPYAHSLPMDMGNEWGGFFVSPITVIGLGVHGWVTNNKTTKKLSYEIAQAVVYSEAIHFVIKMCVGRARPYWDQGPYAYKAFDFANNNIASFPAGHTTNAFAFSTVLSRNAPTKFLKIVAYVPALLTFASRVYQDHHWISDVVVGAAIGYFVGNWIVNLHIGKESRVKICSVYPLDIKIALN